jgi:hypothetical protein
MMRLLSSAYEDEVNSGSLMMFFYNIRNGTSFELDETNGANMITPIINSTVSMNTGYALKRNMFNLANEVRETLRDVPVQDLGITIVMMSFGRYYARNQYPIMVNALNNVKELEHLELFLKAYGKNVMALEMNLATDKVYGLKANKDRFVGKKHLELLEFKSILAVMKISKLNLSSFVDLLSPLHIRIVESFYMLTSITKESKIITECRELSGGQRLRYTFVAPVKTSTFTGDYWFMVPPGSVWFAYHRGRRMFQTYLSRDIDTVLDNLFETIPQIVMGFVHNGHVFPIMLDDPMFVGNWDTTIDFFRQYNFSVVFTSVNVLPPPIEHATCSKYLYFVKNQITCIYKFIKNKQ